MNLDFAKVCGKHSAIYEAYYKQIDPKGSGAIEAMTAAKFLKKSGLSDVVLSRVWDLSDPNGKGFLDKPGFFVALKLVSLAQAGQVANMNNIYVELANPPKVGDLPKIMPPRIQTVPVSSGGVANGDWSISVIDRLKYEQLFESLKPVNGMLPGNKVKGVLMDSKLPMETLGKIWDLADQDKDGNLDKHEFLVAMHLVYQTLEKRTVPDVLPVELRKTGTGGPPPPKPMPPVVNAAAPGVPRAPSGEGFSDGGFVANFPKDIAPPPVVPPLPAAVPPMTRVPPVGGVQPLIPTDPLIPIGAPPSVTANADWVVIPTELKRYEVIFRDSDRDKDGLVSGLEVKNVFLQSGVPQQCLAHIWALCDTNQSGKLTLEQFALAMWMVERKQKGIEPPQVLTANMVPPSMRGIISGVDLQPQAEPKPTYSNPELEMISKEIEELAKERRALETEIAQKEADIRIKSGEVRSLQSELDTLSATLKQLEHQRGEAQKRLDDLKAQSTEYHDVINNLNLELSSIRNQVNKIREQCQKQEETINEQEGELNAKRSELQKLKDEETALQQEYDENNRELQSLTKHLQNTQLQISSVRSMVTQLMEAQRQMTDALLMCRAAIENQDGELVSEYQLKIEPDFDEARKTLEKKIEDPKPDPFEATTTTITSSAQPMSNGFTANGFGSDPFAGGVGTTNTIRSGFDDSFNTSGFDSGFDAFGGSSAFGQQKDPFGSDAFGASKPNAVTPEPGKDDFGSDPFAALHAPTGQGQVLSPNTQKSGPPPRPESPSPALPPKKSKVPPPRPAPPRPVQGPPRPSSATDGFGSTSNSGGFADFADFDNKLTSIPQPTASSSSPVFPPSWLSPLTAPKASLDDMSLFAEVPTTADDTMTTRTSPFTQAFASSTTATITTTTASNHLTRSITPLQQSASILKTTMTTTTTKTTMQTTAAVLGAASKSTVPLGPTDFSDDPFKDYRYEDPFNIKDPFDDSDNLDPEQVFKDDLSSDDEKKPKATDFSAFARMESNTPNDFANHFGNLQINPSPVPSHKSTASGGNLSGSGASFGFPQNNNRSQRNTPVFGSTAAGGGNQFDCFADFDAFSTKSSSTVGSLGTGAKEKSMSRNSNTNNTNNNNTNDSFFEAFNDNFDTNSNAELKKPVATNVLSAFGDTNDAFQLNSNETAAANAFDDSTFEDDFFKSKPNNSTKDSSNFNFDININNNKSTTINNFAKFDAFGDSTDFAVDFATALNNSINTTTKATHVNDNKLQKIQNETKESSNKTNLNVAVEQGQAKPPSKFAADYSNADSFDADLEEALKRSMLEK